MLRFINSMRFALNGIFYALRNERNVRIWFVIMIITLGISFCLKISILEFIIIMLWMFMIGAMEYANTAIEKLADRVTTDYDEQIKRVKDISAGATFITSVGAFISCMIIFVPKLIEILGEIGT